VPYEAGLDGRWRALERAHHGGHLGLGAGVTGTLDKAAQARPQEHKPVSPPGALRSRGGLRGPPGARGGRGGGGGALDRF
jgi:hypothetical protein